MNKQRLKYLIGDFLVAIVVWGCFFAFRRFFNDFRLNLSDSIPFFLPSYNLWLSFISYPFLVVFVHYLSGFYNKNYSQSRLLGLLSTFSSALISTLITYFAILIDDVVVSYTFYYKSFLVLFALQFLLTYAVRFTITQRKFNRIKQGKFFYNTLVIGTGNMAKKTTEAIENKVRNYGNKIMGYVTVGNKPILCKGKIMGDIAHLETIIAKNNVQDVIIAIDNIDNNALYKLINQLLKHDVSIQIPPTQLEILTGKIQIKDIDSSPFVTISDVSMPAWQQSVKRVFDIVVSIVALLIFLPILAFLAIRIKRESKAPIFYKQERVGLNGKPFNILKLRTMYRDAEKSGPKLSSKNDPRITPFGRTLRKYRIDEIPQFWNILKGEMSVVGPRPERRFFIRQIMETAPYYCLLYKIQPGLFSWGPVKVGYSDTIEKMVERLNYDIIYMSNMSLLNDLKIILYNFEVVFRGKGV